TMNKDRADRTFPGRFFVFVSPAAIVSQSRAVEELRIIGGRRLVDEHEQNLAFDIDALVVVPVVFGSVDSIADKNNRRVHICLRLLLLVVRDVIIERLEIGALAIGRDQRKRSRRQWSDTYHWHLLHVSAVIAGRLQSVELKL